MGIEKQLKIVNCDLFLLQFETGSMTLQVMANSGSLCELGVQISLVNHHCAYFSP